MTAVPSPFLRPISQVYANTSGLIKYTTTPIKFPGLLLWGELTIKTLPTGRKGREVNTLFRCSPCVELCVNRERRESLAFCFLHHIKINMMLWEALLGLQQVAEGLCQSFAAAAWVIRTSGDDRRPKERRDKQKRQRGSEITEERGINRDNHNGNPKMILITSLEKLGWAHLNSSTCAGFKTVTKRHRLRNSGFYMHEQPFQYACI